MPPHGTSRRWTFSCRRRLLRPRQLITAVATPRDPTRVGRCRSASRRTVANLRPRANPDPSRSRPRSRPINGWRLLPHRLVPGRYEITLVQGPDTVRAPLVVREAVARDGDGAPDVLAAWASAHGGTTVARDDVSTLPALLDRTLRPEPRATTWHPLRSPWWIVPLALALALEWWTRRRRGLA